MARIITGNDLSRKDVILNAAAALFREKGYKAASMRDLAEKVGVEAASLYNHIRSKTEILHDICFNIATLYSDHMDQVETSTASSLKKVETVLRFQINQMIHNYAEVYVADREWQYLAEPHLSTYQNIRHTYRKRLNAIITRGIENNEIKEVNVPSAIWIMLHAISGIESWHRSKTKVDPAVLEENIISILIDGLRKN